MDLLEELKNLIDKLNQAGIDYALCGGLALAVYAMPRATLDIDMMIEDDSLSQIKKVVSELGFSVEAAPMEFHDRAVKIHRLSKINPNTGENLVLDLLLVTQATNKAWQSRHSVEWEGGSLKVVSPQGLILLKSLRDSGQDKDDIEYLRSILDED
jgi:hypothetical protein